MKRLLLITTPLLILVLILAAIGCGEDATPTPAPTATATVQPTPTATSSLTVAPTPATTPTVKPSPTPATALTSTPTGTPAATATAKPTPAPTPIGAAKPEGELKIAVGDLGEENPDPVFNAAQAKKYLVLMYDHLVGGTPDGELSTENGIANKWENSPDYKTWTFYLREGVKFHNGDDLTAEDVKFSLERLGTPGARMTFAAAIYGTIQEIVVEEPYKLTVRLKSPSFFLPYELSPVRLMEGFVYPKKYFEANGQDYFRSHPIGSGPYRFAQQQVGSYITFEALDNHWSLGVPRYKTVTFYKAPEEITRVAMLKSGDADVIDASREQAPALKKAGFNLAYSPTGEVIWLAMHSQTGTRNPMSDRRVREALVLAIDKQTILDSLFAGQGEPVGSSSTYPFTVGSVPGITPVPYDPERAKALLAEAGYPERFDPEITIHFYPRAGLPENGAMLEAIASYWMKVGVRVRILPTDFTTYRSAMIAQNLPNAVSAVSSPPGKFVSTISAIVGRSVPPGAWAYLTNPPDLGYDALVDEMVAAQTFEKSVEVAKKITQYNYDNVRNPAILLIRSPYAGNEKTKGWDMGYFYYGINVRGLVKR